jgi:hypothetical protein
VGIRAALRALAGPTIDLEWAGGSATLVRANQLVRLLERVLTLPGRLSTAVFGGHRELKRVSSGSTATTHAPYAAGTQASDSREKVPVGVSLAAAGRCGCRP